MAIDIEKIFANLPEAEKKLPCCIVDRKVYTWEQAIQIIREKSPLAKKIEKKITRLGGLFK